MRRTILLLILVSVICLTATNYGCQQQQQTVVVPPEYPSQPPSPSCEGSWDVTYQRNDQNWIFKPGDNVYGTIEYQINNNSYTPDARAQLFVGIIDYSNKLVSDVICIYDDIPRTCPDWTSATANFQLRAPSTPGNYLVICTKDRGRSCSEAKGRFLNQERITIAGCVVQ